MERLTEWIGNGEERHAIPRTDLRRNGHNACCNKLAEYEDLEEQGLLLKLPCKVGDTVFVVDEYYNPPIIKSRDFSFILYQFWGRTVFLTKEEAEKALAEMEEK